MFCYDSEKDLQTYFITTWLEHITCLRPLSNLSQARSSNIRRIRCIPVQITIALYCTYESTSILQNIQKKSLLLGPAIGVTYDYFEES